MYNKEEQYGPFKIKTLITVQVFQVNHIDIQKTVFPGRAQMYRFFMQFRALLAAIKPIVKMSLPQNTTDFKQFLGSTQSAINGICELPFQNIRKIFIFATRYPLVEK